MLSAAIVLAALLVIGGVSYLAYNSSKPASPLAIQGLENGTVTIIAGRGEGTGTLINIGGEWQVVTAAHVVGDNAVVQVIGRDGSIQRARVLSSDAAKDLAIVAVTPQEGWQPLSISDDLPLPGEKVLTRCLFDAQPREGIFEGGATSNHNGLFYHAQLDFSSLLAPISNARPEGLIALLSVQPGCSGAPMLNKEGAVIGIIVAGSQKSAIAVSSSAAFDPDD